MPPLRRLAADRADVEANERAAFQTRLTRFREAREVAASFMGARRDLVVRHLEALVRTSGLGHWARGLRQSGWDSPRRLQRTVWKLDGEGREELVQTFARRGMP